MDTPQSPDSPSQPPESAPVTRPKVKANRIFYAGKLEPLMQLGTMSVIFTYLTLGAYYFKASPQIVAYIASRIAINKKIRVRSTGQTAGLFKAVLPGLGAVIASVLVLQWSVSTQNFLIFFLMLPLVYAAFHATLFLAKRYRFSHLYVGDAPIKLTLSLKDYMTLIMKRAGLNLVTFGYTIPKSDLLKWNQLTTHLQVGGTKFSYQGDTKTLGWLHMISFYIPCLLAVVFLLLAGPMISADASVSADRVSVGRSLVHALFYVTVACGILGRAWYHAALRAEYLRGLRLGGLRFKSAETGKDFFKYRSINLLILVGTLGLGYPLVLHRKLEWAAKTVVIAGEVEALLERTNPTAAS